MTITLAAVSAATDVKSGTALVRLAAREYRKATDGATSATIGAGLATQAAYATGVLRVRGEGQGDMTQVAYAALYGVAPSYVRSLHCLGAAIVRHGFALDSDTVRILVAKNGYALGTIREAAITGSKADFTKAMSEAFDPSGERKRETVKKRKPGKVASEKGSGLDVDKAAKDEPMAVVTAILAALTKCVPHLTDEDLATASQSVADVFGAEVGKRASVARGNGTDTGAKAPTVKRAARKSA